MWPTSRTLRSRRFRAGRRCRARRGPRGPGGPPPAVQVGRVGDQRPLALHRPVLVHGKPDPAGQPADKVVGRQAGIEVGVEIVERAEHRRHDVVESRGEPLRQLVLLVEGGQRRAQRMRALEVEDRGRAPLALDPDLVLVGEHQRVGGMSRRWTASPRWPVFASARNRRASSTNSVPARRWRTEYTSPTCRGRPNGQPDRPARRGSDGSRGRAPGGLGLETFGPDPGRGPGCWPPP